MQYIEYRAKRYINSLSQKETNDLIEMFANFNIELFDAERNFNISDFRIYCLSALDKSEERAENPADIEYLLDLIMLVVGQRNLFDFLNAEQWKLGKLKDTIADCEIEIMELESINEEYKKGYLKAMDELIKEIKKLESFADRPMR